MDSEVKDSAGLRLSLRDKVVLVTGASSGLGRSFATFLHEAGGKVFLAARRLSALEALAGELYDSDPGGENRVGMSYLDVTDPESVDSAIRACVEQFGGIDVVVNNSGISLVSPILDQSGEDWRKLLDTNLTGSFLVARSAAQQMKQANRGGSIINVASILGIRQSGHVAAYSASKAALIQLTKSMALEFARYGIRVNALAPGYIRTDLNRAFFETAAGEALIKRIPQRRLGTPEDLQGPLLLLASDASRYMTGSVVVVDGGHLVSPL